MQLRELETNECRMLQKMAERRSVTPVCGGAMVGFRRQGNFTIALLHYDEDLYLGAAKRNPGDPRNPEVAERLALYRALDQAVVDRGTVG